MGLGWRREGDGRETKPSMKLVPKRPGDGGSCHPLCESGQWLLWLRQLHFPHMGPWIPAHPLQPQELTFGCPSRRSLWNTWQNFQQSTALLERGSRLTTDQKVCAPFSWWVPSMHGEGRSWKTKATNPGMKPLKATAGAVCCSWRLALPITGHRL